MMNILLNGTGGLLVATINDNGCGWINWTPKKRWFVEEAQPTSAEAGANGRFSKEH